MKHELSYRWDKFSNIKLVMMNGVDRMGMVV